MKRLSIVAIAVSLMAAGCSKDTPTAPSATMPATASGLTSNTTQSWPARVKRRTMLAPIRPRPIIPSCMG